MLTRLKDWARNIRRDVMALWLAMRDRRTPWHAKVVAGVVTAYALSPIDLIPDFVPVLGYLDDIVLVPLGIWFVVRLIPADLMAEFRAEAARLEGKPRSPAGAAMVVAIWVACAGFVAWWFWPQAIRR